MTRNFTRTFRALTLVATSFLPAVAMAQTTTDVLIDRLKSEGYTRIEIKQGVTQTKVEAILGTEKLEFVYDNETGAILTQEREAADADEVGTTGIEIDSRDEDFVGNDDDDDDDENDDKGGHDGGHDDNDDDSDDDDDNDSDSDDDDDDSDDDHDDK